MSFNTETTVRLIDLYRKNEVLWRITNKNYRRVDIKNSAMQQIANELNLNVEDVKKKIRNLRNTYVQHKKLKSSRERSGSGVGDDKKTWFLFDEMKFLDEVVVLRTSSSNYETETDNSAVEYEVAEEATDCFEYEGEASMSTMPAKKTIKNKNKYELAIAEICAQENSKPTLFQTFSSTVALQLEEIQKLNVAEAFSCMHEIQNVIGKKLSELLRQKSSTQTCCTHHTISSPTDIKTSRNSNSYTIPPSLTSKSSNLRTFRPSATKTSTTSTPISFTKRSNFSSFSNSQDDLYEFSPSPQLETSNSSASQYKISPPTLIPQDFISNATFNIPSPPPYPIPESKRIKVVDDVKLMFKYDTSLLNNAIMTAGITDEGNNSETEYTYFG